MAGEITVTETVVAVNATVSPVVVTVTETPVAVTVTNQGLQGAKGSDGTKGDTGASGVVSVTAPITNSGTSTAATIGINQSGISIASTQITDKGAANGVATLDGSGLVPTSQIPPLAISDTFVVASQAAMLALTAQVGDVAVRTDVNKTFILQTAPASTLANWIQVLTPPAITSITASSPLTGGTITSTGTIGIDQTALTIAPAQVTGTAVVDSDSRLTNARTPTAHASTHGVAGSDPITIAESQVTNLTTDLAGKAATGANSDITSLSGLTTPLSVGQGGTGQATLTSGSVLIGNGTSGVTTTAVTTTGESSKIVKTGSTGSIQASTVVSVLAGINPVGGAVSLSGATSGSATIQAPAVASGTQTMPTTSGTLVSTGMTGANAQVSDTMLVSGVTISGAAGAIVKTGTSGLIVAGSGGVTSTGGAVVTGSGILVASSAASPPAAGTLQATTVSAGTGGVSSTGNITTTSTGSITSATTLTATGLNTAGVVTNTSAGLLQTSATLSGARGGTGVANTGRTITVSGNVSIGSGTANVTLGTIGDVSVTLPTSGYLLTGSSGFNDGSTLNKLQATVLVANVTQVIATYTVDSGSALDYIIKIANTASAVITLPTPSSYPNRVLKFIHQTATSCTAPAGSVVPLNSATAGTALFSSATTAGRWTELVSDGTNWLVVAQN